MPQQEVCREQIMSEDYWDFIVNDGSSSILNGVATGRVCTQSTDSQYEIIYLDRLNVGPLQLDRFFYSEIPKCYTLLDMEAMNQAGITPIQNYPTLQLQGEDVIIGFLDTGIDYENTVFRNLDGTTRIAGIWDQTIQTGAVPEGLSYGTEYTREMIDEALRSEDPKSIVPSDDEDGHGTFTASLASGNGNAENRFIGAAPESTIAVVKLKPAKQYLRDYYFIREDAPCYQENDIMLGMKYLHHLAEREGKPLVFCVALGTNMGGHGSFFPLTELIEHYCITSKRAVVVGGGNEADARHHYRGQATPELTSQEIEVRVEEGVRGFTTELWTDVPNILEISVVSPSGERIPRLAIRAGTSATYRFVFENTEIYIDYRFLVQNTNSELIFFRFSAPTQGIWKIIVEPTQVATGIYHLWLPVTEFLDAPVYFLEANPDTTITMPSTGRSPMTIAYYDGANNSIAINSGRGYTRSGEVSPDFAAPGVNVTGALPGNRFVSRSGSSIATAIAAGAAALLMEWIVYVDGWSGVNSIQIKNLLILGAERKVPGEYPNKAWGYGALNLYNTFEQFRRF